MSQWTRTASGLFAPAPPPEPPPPAPPPVHCQQCDAPLPGADAPFALCGPQPPAFRHAFVCGHEVVYTCRACFEARRYAKCSQCGETGEYT
jgi:hypothetical protein